MSEVIYIKSDAEIDAMRVSGRITAGARSIARQAIRDGISTKEIDREVRAFILKSGATPTFYRYGGFPGNLCISVNEEVIHGIPGARRIHTGDIVSVDVGAFFGGFTGDCAGTYPVGEVSEEAKRLMEVTRQSFFEALKVVREGNRISDIGAAVQEYCESRGFGVVRDYVGHGVGRRLHEAPEIPNFLPDRRERRPNPRLKKGMCLAIEPMITAGDWHIRVLDNDWTVVTVDGSLAAHYENTVCVTDGEAEILTMADDI